VPDGIVVIDKPAGMTSHDVVDRVRDIFQTKKVGHAGTLDPDATGVLLIGVGRATRFLSYAQGAPKSYRAVARFGTATSTQDASGDVIETKDVSLTREQLEIGAEKFVGEISQVPPMVSAVRIGGQRLHRMARMGKEIEREPRGVKVYELKVVDFTSGDVTEATLDIRCSGGTYIRTLIHDLGVALGTVAHMARLVRTETGGFTLDDAVPLSEITPDHLRPVSEAVKGLFKLEVDPDAVRLVTNGRPLNLGAAKLPGVEEGDHVAVVSGGNLIAVYKRKGPQLKADRVIGR
jgi:tRNA pseudouridine55 synthase